MRRSCWQSLNVSITKLLTDFIDLVAMRSQNTWPEDPLTHMKDYFGNLRSPEWDVMEQISEENDKIKESLPDFEKEIV